MPVYFLEGRLSGVYLILSVVKIMVTNDRYKTNVNNILFMSSSKGVRMWQLLLKGQFIGEVNKFGKNRAARMSPPEKYFSERVHSILIIV